MNGRSDNRAGWVRWSTPESRSAGVKSLLACIETALCVVIYWAIAIVFDTHIHLITSIFVAPFLLLRSSKSIKAGLKMFRQDWVGISNYPDWSHPRKLALYIVPAALGGVIAYLITLHFVAAFPQWVSDIASVQDETFQNRGAVERAFVGALAATVLGSLLTTALLMAVVRVVEKDKSNEAWDESMDINETVLGPMIVAMAMVLIVASTAAWRWAAPRVEFSVSGLGEGILLGFVTVFMVLPVISFLVLSIGRLLGLAVRAVVCRVFCTVLYIYQGAVELPSNWRYSNFVIDCKANPEFLPGIDTAMPQLSFKAFSTHYASHPIPIVAMVDAFGAIFVYLPSLLYRANIKATAWFYWPLAYLLTPIAPGDDREGRHALSWPITNRLQYWLILLGGVWLLVLVLAIYINVERLNNLIGLPAAPGFLKVFLATEWGDLAPWHWGQLLVAVSGFAILYIASDAVSKYEAGLRPHEEPLRLKVMTALIRTRQLATISCLFMGLGALLLYYYPEFVAYHLPARWNSALCNFYRTSC